MATLLTTIAPQAYLNDYYPFFGVIEITKQNSDIIWKFNASQSGLAPPTYSEKGNLIKRDGFRPASVERLSGGLTLVAGWHRGFVIDEDGDINSKFTNPLMNDTHEIQITSNGTYLIASTGMDTILELDKDFNEIWRWHMWEHVDRGSRPDYYYPPDFVSKDCRHYAMYPDNRYHLNYVTESESGDILASALNYGIFKIHRQSGKVNWSYTDLDECHNPYQIQDAYVVCESGSDRVIRLGPQSEREVLFSNGLNFVKDADLIDQSGNWLLTDTKNDRLLIWNINDPEPKQVFRLCVDANPYEADFITTST